MCHASPTHAWGESVSVPEGNTPGPELADRDALPGRRYEDAPIAEAVIEIRVELPSDVSLEQLSHLVDDRKDEYPKVEGRFNLENQLTVAPEGVESHASSRQIGHVFTSADGKQITHSRVDAFSFARLKPYDRWDNFHAQAMDLWAAYVRVAQPLVVTRVAARFINDIRLQESPPIDLKDYLRTYPEIASTLPQTVTAFFMQVALPLPDHGSNATITSTVGASDEASVSLILDIDCYKDVRNELDADDFEGWLNGHLSSLRQAKNYVFEASITSQTRELFGRWLA